MKKLFSLLTILACSLLGNKIYAQHILGGAISYKYVSSTGTSSTYNVTLELYATCFILGPGESLPNMTVNPEIELMKSGTRIGRPKLTYVPELSNQDITPLCPSAINGSSCRSMDGEYIGVKMYVYSADIVLPERDADWEFVFNGALTSSTRAMINKFVSNAEVINPNTGPPPTYDIIHLVAKLNNTNVQNSSTVYTSPPIPFCCKGKMSYYGLGASDDDHDQLKYKLISAQARVGTYVDPILTEARYYNPPFSGEHPLPTVPNSFTLNQLTGQLSFIPDSALNCLVAIQTDEYRDGVWVGSTMREITAFINEDCSSEAPNTTFGNIEHVNQTTDTSGNVLFSACEGFTDTVSIDINAQDPNGDNVTITSANLPADAIVTIDGNGTQTPVVHFKWAPTDALPATYFFYLTYTDDGCPYVSSRNIAYSFTIVPHNIQFTTATIGSCVAFADGKASVVPIGETTIDYNYKWIDTATGTIIRNVNSTIGDTLTNVPPGVYKVMVRNSDGCGKNFYLRVDTTFVPQFSLPPDTNACENLPMVIGKENDELETYQWNTGQDSSYIVTNQSGTYVLTATNHCGSYADSINLQFFKCNYCIFVPSAFSPNGDGKNDLLRIIQTCQIYKIKIQIFNRWGQLVFTSLDINKQWDGTNRGKILEQGTYFYYIETTLDDETHSKSVEKGEITLIR